MSDLALALRQLSKTPGFTLVAVLTLALGIGLNTAMFSLMNTVLLRPLPFERAESLVRLYRATPRSERGAFAPVDYLELKRQESAFGQFAAYAGERVSLAEAGRAADVQEALRVSTEFLTLLGVRPELGRSFRREEGRVGSPRVAILSHALWRNRFGAAHDVVGRTVRIDGDQHEIVGVLPAWANDGRVIRAAAVFRPLSFDEHERGARDQASINIVGRRADSLSGPQGQAFVAAFGARLATQFPQRHEGSRWYSESLLASTSSRIARVVMAMLLGLSGFVMLIACLNLANLVLTRTLARSRELAVRRALGASLLRLIRPLALESLTLAALGALGALGVAVWACDWLSAQTAAERGSQVQFPLDWRVLGFAVGASLLTALIFGIAPALFAVRADVNSALKSGSRGSSADRGHQRLRQVLVVGQFGMATTLLAGAGFFERGVGNLLAQDFGWESAAVATGAFHLPAGKYDSDERILAFHRSVSERLQQLPGVREVSLNYSVPYIGLNGPRDYVVLGRERPAKGRGPSARYNGISPTYFAVTGTRLLRGRPFDARDTAASPRVVIVNASMARELFPNENAIGRRLAPADGNPLDWAEIVGVAADVRAVDVYARPVAFQVYHPFAQAPWAWATFAVRTELAPEALLEPIRSAFAALDPDLPVRDLMTADKLVRRGTSDVVLLQRMLSGFALLGLALAALGIYGVMARTVAQRTGEIGIRMALGARMTDVLRLMLGYGLRLALIGALAGLAGALGLARLIGTLMPALQTNGNLVLAGAVAAQVLVALIACYVPAQRAARVDPLVALRSE